MWNVRQLLTCQAWTCICSLASSCSAEHHMCSLGPLASALPKRHTCMHSEGADVNCKTKQSMYL